MSVRVSQRTTSIVGQTKVSMAFNERKKCTFCSAKLDKPRVCVCQCILKFSTAIGLKPSASFCGKVNRCYVCGSKVTQITFTWMPQINLIFLDVSRLGEKRGTKMKVDRENGSLNINSIPISDQLINRNLFMGNGNDGYFIDEFFRWKFNAKQNGWKRHAASTFSVHVYYTNIISQNYWFEHKDIV